MNRVGTEATDAMERLLSEMGAVKSLRPSVEQISSMRALVRHTQDPPYDFDYHIQGIALHWRDGRRINVRENGHLSS